MIDERVIRDAIATMQKATQLLQWALQENVLEENKINGIVPDLAFLDKRLTEIDFSTRARSAFTNCNFYWKSKGEDDPLVTVRDLVRCTRREMLRTPNLGLKTLKEIEEVLAEHGLRLKE